MKKIYPLHLISLLLLVIFLGCLKGNFKLKKIAGSFWEPDIAIPLVNASMNLQKILTKSNANGNFSIGADNLITLIYRGNLFSLMAKDFIKIPNQLINDNVVMSDNTLMNTFNNSPLPHSYTFPSTSTVFNFNPGTGVDRVDSLTIRNGLISINLKSYFPQQVTFKITIPNAKNNGIAFTQTLSVPPASLPNNAVKNFSFDLSGYNFALYENGSPNKLKIEFETTVSKVTNVPLTSSCNSMDFAINFSDLTFEKLFGNIGYKLLAPDKDTVALSIFNNVLSGGINLPGAYLKINISNSFGIPINAKFEELIGYNPVAASPLEPIFGQAVSQDRVINAPASVGGMAYTSFSMSQANSNVANVFQTNTPKFLIYKLRAESNPPPASQLPNFMLDTSRFKVDMEINLPLNGSISNLIFQDTIQFRFQEVNELQSLSLITYFNNGFPLDANIQVYFADSLGFVLDSLLDNGGAILKSASVGADGKVNATSENTVTVNCPPKKLEKLDKVRMLYVKASTSTFQNGATPVKIYSDYKLDLRISGRAKLKFKV